jgi:translin
LDLGTVEESLSAVEKNLTSIVERREKLIKQSRDIISSCSKTIVNLHNGRFKEARTELATAKKLLMPLRKEATDSLGRYLIPSETEFVEASVVAAIVAEEKKLPTMSSLGVSSEAYILGLLDSIGEMKRLVLASIIRGDLKGAASMFETMEQLYSLLSHFAAYDNIVAGTRRKMDVDRMLIEDTRGIMAEETRREHLDTTMNRLLKKLERGVSSDKLKPRTQKETDNLTDETERYHHN